MATATLYRNDAVTYGPIYPVWPRPEVQATAPRLTSSSEIADPWQQVIERVQSFALLGDDGDGERSSAPAPQIVNTAVAMARQLRRQDAPLPSRVTLGPDGTIIFEWQAPQGQADVGYFEIEVCAPNFAEWMLAVPGQPTQHGEMGG